MIKKLIRKLNLFIPQKGIERIKVILWENVPKAPFKAKENETIFEKFFFFFFFFLENNSIVLMFVRTLMKVIKEDKCLLHWL